MAYLYYCCSFDSFIGLVNKHVLGLGHCYPSGYRIHKKEEFVKLPALRVATCVGDFSIRKGSALPNPALLPAADTGYLSVFHGDPSAQGLVQSGSGRGHIPGANRVYQGSMGSLLTGGLAGGFGERE